MDGLTFDQDLHEAIMRHAWEGLFIEPMPKEFEHLKYNYRYRKGLKFCNWAVDDLRGERNLHHAILNENSPSWHRGLGSFRPERNALTTMRLDWTQVHCERLDEILTAYGIPHFDVLQIDTEGHDWVVLEQVDLDKRGVRVAKVEIALLTENEKALACEKFSAAGFQLQRHGMDLIATR